MVRFLRSFTAYLALKRMKSLKAKTHEDYIREGIQNFKINVVPCDNKVPYGRVVFGLNEFDNSEILEKMKLEKSLMDRYEESDYEKIVNIAPYFLIPTLAMDYLLHGTGFVLSTYKYGYRETVGRIISKTTMGDDIQINKLDEEIYQAALQLKEIMDKQKDTDIYRP